LIFIKYVVRHLCLKARMTAMAPPHTDRNPRTFWQVFSAAPHRMLFLGGGVQIVLVMLLWTADLAGRATGAWALPWSVPPSRAHMFLMVYGLFPFFIFGFLLTVYPRWMGGAPVPPARYVPAFAAVALGTALFYAGLFSTRAVAAAGVAAYALGWTLAGRALLAVYRRAPVHGVHERLLNVALGAGLLGLLAFLAALAGAPPFWFALAREIGVWLFLVPVVFLVSHRMIPFFSQSVLVNYLMVRPAWGPPLMLVCAGAHAALELAGMSAWRFLADAPLAAAALQHTRAWRFRRSFHARLLAMLHIAFLWLGIAMTLYALQSLALLVSGHDWFGRAPLHALGIGFFTGMVVAMASRVTLGHAGRALLADQATWAALLGVNVAAALRVAGELWPAAGAWLNLLAGVVWLVMLGVWAGRYLPMYLRPRIDRRPG
jgi:uncharacterized protein involved in response to NO